MAVEALFAILIGLSGGLAVGSGLVAFITVLGIIPRLVQLTKTQKAIQAYEIAVITGAMIGSIATLHDIKGIFPAFFTIPVGLAAGMFVGMLAAALTEVLNVLPILAKRIGLEKNIIVLVMAIVLGKIFGSLFHWIFFVKF